MLQLGADPGTPVADALDLGQCRFKSILVDLDVHVTPRAPGNRSMRLVVARARFLQGRVYHLCDHPCATLRLLTGRTPCKPASDDAAGGDNGRPSTHPRDRSHR